MTTSGKTVYTSIKAKIAELEREYHTLASSLQQSEAVISGSVNNRERLFSELAVLYLPELDRDSVKSAIRELQQEVNVLFQRKQQRRQELDSLTRSSIEKKDRLQEGVESLDRQLEDKAAQRNSLEKQVAQELQQDESYTHLHQEAQQSQTCLDQNKQRYETFKAEAERKLRGYEEEPLFRYLVNRGYGTSRYAPAMGIARRLDDWVAKMVEYKQAKPNYDFLCSMPEAIESEINARQKDLDAVVQQLAQMEQRAADKNGLTNVLQEGKALLLKREEVVAALGKTDGEFGMYSRERKELDSTKDPYHRDALTKLKAYLKGETITELKKRAKSTPSPDDDGLVDKIEAIDLNIKQGKQKAKKIQQDQASLTEIMSGLKKISKRYADREYESSRSYFDTSFSVNGFLLGYLSGRISLDEANRTLDQHHHFKPRESYSSYSSGSYTSSSGYTSGSHSGSGFGGGGSSSSGGFGGGGFSGGGGFGGGGFSSGGGF